MEQKLKYVQVCSTEMFGCYGAVGVKILVAAPNDREIGRDEGFDISRSIDQIRAIVLRETIRLDPQAAIDAAAERADLIALFPSPIFVETIPNGYCPLWCCEHKPWFVVTTTRGRITIGWRKRVIEIKWDECVAPRAAELFPNEDVTKEGRLIHAWGLEKAREYVVSLLAPASLTEASR